MFEMFSEETISKIALAMKEIIYGPEEYIFSKGSIANSIYYI